MSGRWIVLLLAALSLGCVGKGKYSAALAEQDELRNRIDGMNAAMSEMGAELTHNKEGLQTCQAALEDTSRQLAQKMAEAGALQQNVAEMQQALTELEMRRAQIDAALSSYRELVVRFKAMIDAGTLQVKVIEGRMVVELATDILFPAGSASLSRGGRKAIREVALVLAKIPDREYQVVGHTDDVPIATAQFPSNWHLGAARAISVTQLLTQEGLPAHRISAASYADQRPADTNRTKDGRARNRRIEIVVVPDMSLMPGYEELASLADGSETEPERSGPVRTRPQPQPAPGTRTRPE